MNGDDLGNGLGSHAQGVVSLAKGVEHGEFRINLAQALVVDDQQGVHMLVHLLDTVERLVNLTVTLETEGDGDDADGEDAHLLGHPGDDRCSTRARTATHAGCDESHAGAVVEHLLDILQALLSGSPCLLGPVAGTQSLLAQLQMYGYG